MEPAKLATVPPMGWNSWNKFGVNVNEKAIRGTADTMVSAGFRELGYEYIVIDDCWSRKCSRDKNGDLVADPEKFPNGIKALADYIHDRGLKIGIYSDAADKTCGGWIGSYGFEEQDAALWASWGIDFLKYDYCHAPQDQASAIERYTAMGRALEKTGRDFLYSICEWGGRSPHLWAAKTGGHMWRVSGDVFDSWVDIWVSRPGYYGIGIDTSIDIAAALHSYTGPGGWNDLDMLVVGLKGKGQIHGNGLSFLEYQTHMSLWSIACSPLMIGCDITALDSETAGLLLNREVLAVNQDPLGIPGKRVLQRAGCDVWTKPLSDGSTALAVINRRSSVAEPELRAGEIGLLDTEKQVRDLWKQQETGDFSTKLSLRVEAHETKFLKIMV
ncbi:MAG: glycoside hydrolase family 27 protein [Spirochaetales bacterium]|nr:glycoside hydrolase family 27 protein [Spirochaetales bacterium]